MDDQLKKDSERFKNLTFEDFKALAQDDSLSVYQKIGFPDEYRKGNEIYIYEDIKNKLGITDQRDKVLLDIGSGCSDLAHLIIDLSKNLNFKLLLVDSSEMLNLLPDSDHMEKYFGYFPDQTEDMVNLYIGKVDYIVCYSIFHYIFYNTCIFKFLDVAVSLLKPGGKLLVGDIPNVSKRKRFFSTDQGVRYHQEFTKSQTLPDFKLLSIEPAQIDDGVIFSILQRYRNFGLETYILPQPRNLPMWNRREDILIEKL